MRALTKEEIRKADDRKLVPLPIPEWSADGEEAGVHLRPLSIDDAKRYSTESGKGDVPPEELLIGSVVNPDGTPMFTAEDAKWLKTKAMKVCERIAQAMSDINGISDEAQENTLKNSESAPSGDSSTD